MRLVVGAVVAAALVAAAVWYVRGDEADRPRASVVLRDSAVEAARAADVDLEALVADAATEALSRLPRGAVVEIEVKVGGGSHVIPQIGVGGFTGGRKVLVEVEEPLRANIATWLPPTVAHELHHVARFRARPRSDGTLAEALVAEGLADHFAREVFPETPPAPWDVALTRRQEQAVWKSAQHVLRKRGGYDHREWFFGGGGLPQWAGYTLGYRIVAAYLGEEGRASDAVAVDPDGVIARYVAPAVAP